MFEVELSVKELYELVPYDMMDPENEELDNFMEQVVQLLDDNNIGGYLREHINKHLIITEDWSYGYHKEALKHVRKLINNLAEEMYAEV